MTVMGRETGGRSDMQCSKQIRTIGSGGISERNREGGKKKCRE
jgi:hypothetical protein